MVKKIMDETNKGFMKHLGGLELKQISIDLIAQTPVYRCLIFQKMPLVDLCVLKFLARLF